MRVGCGHSSGHSRPHPVSNQHPLLDDPFPRHFFYNSPDLDFLVALQAFLTVVRAWLGAAGRLFGSSRAAKGIRMQIMPYVAVASVFGFAACVPACLPDWPPADCLPALCPCFGLRTIPCPPIALSYLSSSFDCWPCAFCSLRFYSRKPPNLQQKSS